MSAGITFFHKKKPEQILLGLKNHSQKMDKHSRFNKWLISIIGVIVLLYFAVSLIMLAKKFM